MQSYTIDPRDGFRAGDSCNTCCCVSVPVKAGEIQSLKINYAAWVIPLRGRGLTQNTTITVDVKHIADPAIATTPLTDTTPMNTNLMDSLSSLAVDPESDPLTFSLAALYGPDHGEIVIQADGDFVYTPATGFQGVDRFYWQVTDGNSDPVIQQAVVSVGTIPAGESNAFRPVIVIPKKRVKLDSSFSAVTMAIDVSPVAKPGDIYRMNVRQQALDCDCEPYYHVSCWDLIISKC